MPSLATWSDLSYLITKQPNQGEKIMKKTIFLSILAGLSALAVVLAPPIAGNRAHRKIKELEEQEAEKAKSRDD